MALTIKPEAPEQPRVRAEKKMAAAAASKETFVDARLEPERRLSASAHYEN